MYGYFHTSLDPRCYHIHKLEERRGFIIINQTKAEKLGASDSSAGKNNILSLVPKMYIPESGKDPTECTRKRLAFLLSY